LVGKLGAWFVRRRRNTGTTDQGDGAGAHAQRQADAETRETTVLEDQTVNMSATGNGQAPDDDLAALRQEVARLADRVDRLESIKAVSHLLYRYVHIADEIKDADVIAQCFTEDAVWEGLGRFDEFKAVGRQAIRGMFHDVFTTYLPFTAHWVTNQIITLSRDGDKAYGQWHILEAANLKENCAQVWLVAWYDNEFVRVDDEWKISHVRLVHTFVCPYEEGWLKTKYVSPITLEKVSEL
jgi:ketosteroid isomerase-like protein